MIFLIAGSIIQQQLVLFVLFVYIYKQMNYQDSNIDSSSCHHKLAIINQQSSTSNDQLAISNQQSSTSNHQLAIINQQSATSNHQLAITNQQSATSKLLLTHFLQRDLLIGTELVYMLVNSQLTLILILVVCILTVSQY